MEVLLARDEAERRVAIKRPFASAPADGLARFQVEASAAVLDHENIAKIYETGVQADGRPYLAMEFVDGKELKEIIDSGERLDLIAKLRLIEQVCSGLGYAHQMGFIHRDIKPGNVMVQANGVAKIIDFGIAKMMDLERTSELTVINQVIGSLHYIAPERFKNEATDGRVDIFSTGVMLYLLLTGKLPFSGGEVTASYQILNEAPTRLGAHIQDYPPALDDIMDQALAKNPDQRFATADDFADALHDVIEDLKNTEVSRLFEDAERLTIETRYEPALELLDEAIKLDPSNTQVRKLRKMVREHQDRRKRSDRVRDYVAKADELLAAEHYADALVHLKDAQRFDSTSEFLRERIAFVETTKRRYERSTFAFAEAEAAKNRGDMTAALRISDAAVKEDPDNTKLIALREAIAKQLEREKLQASLNTLFDTARSELSAKNFSQVEQLLEEAGAIDRSHPDIEEMRREMAQVRARDERRQLLEEIHRRVNDCLRTDDFEQATHLLTRALDKLPGETMLHRLKLEVNTAAQKFDSIRFVDRALALAQDSFAGDPQKALTTLHEALQHMPGDERLIACKRSLQQQATVLRAEHLLSDSLRRARDLITGRQFDKAIEILEMHQLEQGKQTDIEDLLVFARKELASQQGRLLVEKNTLEARSLIARERLDDAERLLESALQSTAIRNYGDGGLSGLLEEVRARKSVAERKRDAIVKRAIAHRERGELDAAIQTLADDFSTGFQNTDTESLLSSLRAERTREQDTKRAIAGAEQATQQGNFTGALQTLSIVVSAYEETTELLQATERVMQARSAYAQRIVSVAIETSRAALLAGELKGALAALRTANEMVEFADAARQADWRRVGQAVKKAQDVPTGTIIADPLADLPEAVSGKKPNSRLVLWLGFAAVSVALGVAATLVFHKAPPPPPPPSMPTEAHITVEKAPQGALVSIDDAATQPVNENGSLTLTVSPGSHKLLVQKDGFDPYEEKFQVNPGGTFHDNIALTKQIPRSNAGTLEMNGNLAAFKVTVDGSSRGVFSKEHNSLSLEPRRYTIQYSNDDGSEALPPHTIEITAGKAYKDSFKLIPPSSPPPSSSTAVSILPGSLEITTRPNAVIKIDGQSQGPADSKGVLTVVNLSATSHKIEISLDGYQAFFGAPTVVSGKKTSFPGPLTPNAPTTGSLIIRTEAGAQISLNKGENSGAADSQGTYEFKDLKPRNYILDITKEGFQPAHREDVTVLAGSNTFVAGLSPIPKSASPPAPTSQTPPVEDHSADYKGIAAAVSNFQTAIKSRKREQVEGAWLNADHQKSFLESLDTAKVFIIIPQCSEQASIDGETAIQRCNEASKFNQDAKLKHTPFKYTFIKRGDKWVLKDRTPLK